MRSKRRVIGVAGCWFIAGGLLAANPLPAWAQLLTTWTGAGGDPYWSTAGNWDTGVVPCNDVDTYDVGIPGGSPVTFDVDAACVVTDLELSADATLTIWPGTNLDVLDDARIGGVIVNENGTFTGVGVGAALTGDKARLDVTGAGSLALSAATYSSAGLRHTTWQGTGTYSWTLFSATDAGTLLDLSSLLSLDAATWGYSDTRMVQVHKIVAANDGTVDLSSLQSIEAPQQSWNRLEFTASAGGVINLASLESVTGSGAVRMTVDSEGTLIAGDLTVTGNLRVDVADVTSVLDVVGSLYLAVGSQLTVAAGATLSIGEHLAFDYTDETAMDTQTAVVHFDGTGTQMLEVGGEDLWTLVDRDLPNFGFGQLVIGRDLGPTTLMLLDVIDNGNRPESDTEALYLYGLGGPQGLRILGGLTLVINNINVYTMIDGHWLHINTLFPPGVETVAYDGGFIALHTAATAGNCTADLAVDLRDFGNLYACLSGPDGDQVDPACTCSDANHDGVIDMRDFAIVQGNFADQSS